MLMRNTDGEFLLSFIHSIYITFRVSKNNNKYEKYRGLFLTSNERAGYASQSDN